VLAILVLAVVNVTGRAVSLLPYTADSTIMHNSVHMAKVTWNFTLQSSP